MKESCRYCDCLYYSRGRYICYYSDCKNWIPELDDFGIPDDENMIDIYPDEEDLGNVLFV